MAAGPAPDPRVLALAARVAEGSERDVPGLLLKLKEILSSASLGHQESKKTKQDIYFYDLIHYCLLLLRQDCSRLHGGWATAAQLAEIISHCCVGLEVKEDPEEFHKKFLPSAIDSLLFLGRRLQARFIRAIKDEEKQDFLRHFQTVTDAICWLFGGHIQLTECVLQNDHFLQLLITDNVETAVIVMSVLHSILGVDEEILHSVLDELVYKLSSSSNPVVGNAATKLLLLMANFCKQLLKLLATRYKETAPGSLYNSGNVEGISDKKKAEKTASSSDNLAEKLQACKFLEKRRRKRTLSPWKDPKGLTDEQRLALQQKVDDYIKLHPASQMSEEMSKELHMQAQEKLAQFLLRSRLDQRAAQRRETLLAQVNTDVELLMNAPRLAEITEKDLAVFMSRSVPVATRARESHSAMLKHARWPWWKKLGDEFEEDDVIPDDILNAELGSLFIGGRKSL
ncbi:hypothetical protein ASZ78_015046 [Callipepla squamata]|uniref:Uncharacterized protein n=1 Tax=Callipepla squamata TaxID=9009 RepID=A0A226NDF6_CALSU|nr:hypothetical protein ASZ78_015046 [Callipepla squamata]